MLISSDIHFGANRLVDAQAFLNAARDPTTNPMRLVVLCGDLTQKATTEEYEQATRFVNGLREGGYAVVLTPGNHDFGQFYGERLWGE